MKEVGKVGNEDGIAVDGLNISNENVAPSVSDNDVIELKDGGVISILDSTMSTIMNFEAIMISVNKSLVFLDGNCSVDHCELEEYSDLKERVDNGGLELHEGDSIVFTVKKDSALSKRGISYVVAIITPEWENGLNREVIVDKMDRGLSEAFMLCSYYDIECVALSNLYPYMPTALVMDLLSHHLLNEAINFRELCVVRGTDAEGVYRINMLVDKLRRKSDRTLYVRLGGDFESAYITEIVF